MVNPERVIRQRRSFLTHDADGTISGVIISAADEIEQREKEAEVPELDVIPSLACPCYFSGFTVVRGACRPASGHCSRPCCMTC